MVFVVKADDYECTGVRRSPTDALAGRSWPTDRTKTLRFSIREKVGLVSFLTVVFCFVFITAPIQPFAPTEVENEVAIQSGWVLWTTPTFDASATCYEALFKYFGSPFFQVSYINFMLAVTGVLGIFSLFYVVTFITFCINRRFHRFFFCLRNDFFSGCSWFILGLHHGIV